jgi:chromosome partitioning protein
MENRQAIVVTFANQKGGVTKTTSVANMAMMFTFAGLRVLIVDCDPQGNLTYTCGYTPDLLEQTLYDCLKGTHPLRNVLRQTWLDPASGEFLDPTNQALMDEYQQAEKAVIPGPDLVPINIVASSADSELQSNPAWGALLRNKLSPLLAFYDYILLDTNPGLGKLTVNAFCAADYVVIPLVPEVLPTQGLMKLVNSMEETRASGINPDLQVAGIIFTRVKYRNHKDIIRYVRNEFAPTVGFSCFKTEIKESAAFSMAAITRSVVVVAEPYGEHALAYWQLLMELVERIGGSGGAQIRQTYERVLQQKQDAEQQKLERGLGKKEPQSSSQDV